MSENTIATSAPRVAWVTGASSGIGRAVALRLAQAGWRVAASARRGDALDSLAAEARAQGGVVVPVPLDVTDAAAVAGAVGRIEEELGPIGLALLNAGTYEPMPAAQFSTGLLRRLLELNLMGTANGLEALLPRMMARGAGRIAVTASLAGYRGLPLAGAYGASKAALMNLAEALRPELQAHGVTLQVVNPGFVRTPLTDRNDFPMPFLVSADQAATAILRGFDSSRFEIAFPWRFAMMLKLARMLPDRLYFRLTARMLGA